MENANAQKQLLTQLLLMLLLVLSATMQAFILRAERMLLSASVSHQLLSGTQQLEYANAHILKFLMVQRPKLNVQFALVQML